jgi:signal transduction histidine kinase
LLLSPRALWRHRISEHFILRNLALFTPIPDQSFTKRYSVAFLTGVLSILLRWFLDPVLGHVAFYATIYICVAYCAFLCGYAPAIVSGIVGFAGVFYWFVDPRRALFPINHIEIQGIVGCFLVSAVLIILGETNRRKQIQLKQSITALTNEANERQRAEAALRKAHDELEQRVIERTAELSQALAQLKSEIEIRQKAETHLRHLSLRLMTLQDEERRRIARDLHDTAGQTLAAIKMSVALIRDTKDLPAKVQPLLDDLNALADEALQEVRTTSYLLHPPLLDEAGIASAARWFVEGFARRSGIDVHCEIPDKMQRPARESELVLFRVLQESLTNVHRHSAATSANVRLSREGSEFHLEVSDNGRGLSEEHIRKLDGAGNHSGVGISGMRERVRELNGNFEIACLKPGTAIRVSLPAAIAHDSSQSKDAMRLAI